MSDNNKSRLALGDVLFIVFLILKLTNTINWSWWWVTAPLWMPFAFIIVITGIAALIDTIKES